MDTSLLKVGSRVKTTTTGYGDDYSSHWDIRVKKIEGSDVIADWTLYTPEGRSTTYIDHSCGLPHFAYPSYKLLGEKKLEDFL